MIRGNVVVAMVVEDGLLCSPAVVVESLELKSMAWVRSSVPDYATFCVL
jgi:hypothetical protein